MHVGPNAWRTAAHPPVAAQRPFAPQDRPDGQSTLVVQAWVQTLTLSPGIGEQLAAWPAWPLAHCELWLHGRHTLRPSPSATQV